MAEERLNSKFKLASRDQCLIDEASPTSGLSASILPGFSLGFQAIARLHFVAYYGTAVKPTRRMFNTKMQRRRRFALRTIYSWVVSCVVLEHDQSVVRC